MLELELPRVDPVGFVLEVTGGGAEPELVEVEIDVLELVEPGELEALEEVEDPTEEVEVDVEGEELEELELVVELDVELDVEICIGTP